ncbi:MAG: hypothetical protein P8Y71_18165 [Pseudolabrys sp.]
MDARTTRGHFDQVHTSKDLSQLIRSNTQQYWGYMKNSADLSSLHRYLSFEGIIAGDPHLGNFSPLPLRRVGGPRQMRFVDVDFDDAGYGPFVLDFVRYVISSKSISHKIKQRSLEKGYLAGLAGKKLASPKKVRALLAIPVAKYDNMAAQYAEKNSSKNGFKFKKGEIEPYEAKITRATIESLLPDRNVIDLAIRPETRGGSVGQLRIWILVESRKSRRIMELKQHSDPAVANYRAQPPVHEWLNEVRQTFWPGLDGSAYDLVDVPGSGLFWKRQKQVSLIDVPYSSRKRRKVAFLDALAVFDANVLGLAHGRQAAAARYRALIENDTEAFHDATKPVVKAYLKLARVNFHDK